MAERVSEKLMWWALLTAGGVGALVFLALVGVLVWGVAIVAWR